MLKLNKLQAYVLGTESSEINVIKNMMKLATGDGFSRVIGIVTMPIITRIYLPEHLGVLSVFIAIVAVIAPITTFRYSLAIPLSRSDGLAINVALLSLIVLTVTSILTVFVFLLFGDELLISLSMEQLLPYWYLIPVAIIGSGIYELLSSWAIRKRAFSPLAKTKIWQKSIGAITKISLGFLGLKPLGLLIGHIFTKAGGIVTLVREFIPQFSQNLKYLTKRRVLFTANRYADFPKFRMPSQIILTFSSKLALFYFAWQFDAYTAGLLGLSLMMVMMPVTLFGYTTGKAYYAEIARIGKENPVKILDLTKSIIKKLVLLSIVPFGLFFVFGPWLFKVIFGNEWIQAGSFTSILSIYLLVQFVYAPISEGIFNVFEKQPIVLMIEIGRLSLTIISFSISYWLNLDPKNTIWIYSILISINYCVAIGVVMNIIIKSIKISE